MLKKERGDVGNNKKKQTVDYMCEVETVKFEKLVFLQNLIMPQTEDQKPLKTWLTWRDAPATDETCHTMLLLLCCNVNVESEPWKYQAETDATSPAHLEFEMKILF